MYTSINCLKTNSACVPGFSRVASFISVKPDVKPIEFPIWMIGLFSEFGDVEWALQNATRIDPAVFNDFQEYSAGKVFQQILWAHMRHKGRITGTKATMLREAVKEAIDVETLAEVKAYLAKWQLVAYADDFWASVVRHKAWSGPVEYTQYIISNMSVSYYYDYKDRMRSQIEEADTPVKRGTATRSKKYTKVRPDPNKELYFLREAKEQHAVAFAKLFTRGKDPFSEALSFMIDTQIPEKSNSKLRLSKVSPEGTEPTQFSASIHLNNPALIFKIYHLINGADFDVLKVLNITPQTEHLESYISAADEAETMSEEDRRLAVEDTQFADARSVLLSGSVESLVVADVEADEPNSDDEENDD